MKSVVPWLCKPTLIEGELLSSYLTRIAHANGLSPYRFTSFHFPGYPIWNRDIDRSAGDEFIQVIAASSGEDIETIEAMTLRSTELLFNCQVRFQEKRSNSVAHWINAAGIYHRDRRCFAMQYCPLCLMSGSAYQKIWRISFVTVCEIHHLPLLDCCLHCGAPIAYHRNDVFFTNCHRCGLCLRHMAPTLADGDDLQIRLQLQTLLLAVMGGELRYPVNQKISPQEFFRGLWILLRGVKSKIRLSQRLGHPLHPTHAECPTGRMELLRVEDRARQCMVISEMLYDWPNQFLSFAALQHLTQVAFKDIELYPTWLHPILAMLAPGVTRTRRTGSAPIRNKLRSIHRYKKDNWRAKRASLLLRKARSVV